MKETGPAVGTTTTTAKHVPYVPATTSMREFTIRALLLGIAMAVVLGAANAYLGLTAGMTIAATYPAAVIGMAVLKLMRGSILEENMARTVGSIGESVAAGAIFTVPAFMIAGVWKQLHYVEATSIMVVGGIIGVLFVTLLRRVMVEDAELPFPESVAASEIHKAGRSGGTGAKFLVIAGFIGAGLQTLKQLKFFADKWEKFIPFSKSSIGLGAGGQTVQGGGGMLLSSPGVEPAFMGVGYIIGPRLAALNFSGGLLAWGLFVPLILFFVGPEIAGAGVGDGGLAGQAVEVWKSIVRPIAIGGMLVASAHTLWKMRKSLIGGMARSIGDVKAAATGGGSLERTDRDLNIKYVGAGVLVFSILTYFLYDHFAGDASAALTATVVMIIAGFLFAAVSGYLVGLIGSSNNPISGLTLSTLIVAALLMVLLGQKGDSGIAAVLGVAGVICVAAAVAGEMLQDLKVGHILGGTPWKMQVGDLIGVVIAAAVMFFPLIALHQGDINHCAATGCPGGFSSDTLSHCAALGCPGGAGFGGSALPAPQASLMAILSGGIVGGKMAWPLIIVGMLMAVAFILVQIKSPMLVFVGMYLPLATSFAIFLGGLVRGVVDKIAERRRFNAAQNARVENTGVLLASGLIAGQALIGLVFAGLYAFKISVPAIFEHPSFITSLFVFLLIGLILTLIPVRNAGSPSEPAPPSAMN